MASPLTDQDRRFIADHPVARLATADAHGAPHVVPICFVVIADTLYLTIDHKPKQDPYRLKRLRNIAENDAVAVVVDHYEDDWSQLAWVMLRGRAEILDGGDEHGAAQAALRARYAQYREMTLDALPVIAVRIARVARWGALG